MDHNAGDTDASDVSTVGKYFPDSKTTLKSDFTIEKLLGDGAFSEVYRAKRKSDNEDVAIKVIRKSKVSQVDLEREVEIWQLASKSSSRVVQLYEIYEDEEIVYLVMELMVGGELFEKIANMTDYSEAYASKIMKQVFLIIRDLHKVHIIHQDLKPENLLLMGDSMILKLCDFGLAEIADDNTELFGCVGSTTYMAPEVTNESGHHKPVDVYAAGVIMYIMLCGYPPFEPENGIVELEFPDREWEEISSDAKDLITQLLDEDPLRRPTPEEVLRHRWLSDVVTIRNPKTLFRTITTLKKFQELGPNGTIKDRGTSTKNRIPVKDLFEESNGAPAGGSAGAAAVCSVAAAGSSAAPAAAAAVATPAAASKDDKAVKGGHFHITGANGAVNTNTTGKKNEATKKPSNAAGSVPQLPNFPVATASPKKKGAKTERSIEQQSSSSTTHRKTESNVKEKDKDKEKEKEKEPKDEKKKKSRMIKKKDNQRLPLKALKRLEI